MLMKWKNNRAKEEILENYLNEIYFSNQVYGIGAAATYYFGKPLNELTEAEHAIYKCYSK